MHNTTKLAARLVLVAVALGLAFGTAAAQQVDTVGAAVRAQLSSAAGEVAPALSAHSAAAAPGDSLRLIAQLLVANGAPERRAGPVAAAVLKYARLRALDPLLVVGIIGVENAELVGRSRSRAGATGVMQVMPHWKRDIRDCGDDLRDVHVNVCFATRILRIALDASTSVREALLRYNGCVRAPGCTRYASAVFSQAGRAVLLSRLTALPVAAPPAPPRAELAAAAGGT